VHILWVLFDWPNGIVVGNLIASMLWALPTWFILLKKLHCAEHGCFRPGRHLVAGTTYNTCQKHTTKEIHDRLFQRHSVKFPDQHDHLN